MSPSARLTFVLSVSPLCLRLEPGHLVFTSQWICPFNSNRAMGRHQRDKGSYLYFCRLCEAVHASHCTAPLSLKLSGTCPPLRGVESLLESNVGQLMFSIEDLWEDSSTSTIPTFICVPVRGPGWLTCFAVERG